MPLPEAVTAIAARLRTIHTAGRQFETAAAGRSGRGEWNAVYWSDIGESFRYRLEYVTVIIAAPRNAPFTQPERLTDVRTHTLALLDWLKTQPLDADPVGMRVWYGQEITVNVNVEGGMAEATITIPLYDRDEGRPV